VRWEDFNGKTLTVMQSVWRKHTTDPKTASAANPGPVIEPLRELLEELRTAEGNQQTGPILRGVQNGKPLNLDMRASETIRPAIANPANYAPDAKRLTWHGYYAFRRGIATLASSISDGRERFAASFEREHNSRVLHQGRSRSYKERDDSS